MTAGLASVHVIRRQVFTPPDSTCAEGFTLVLDQLQSGIMNQSAVSKHYDAAANYHPQYEREGLLSLSRRYPAMPYLESGMQALFREGATRLEHEASGWRELFLCSAFVVEAVKGATP